MEAQNEGTSTRNKETKESLSGQETVEFLLAKGVKRLEVFKPYQPLFYVFEDMYRGDDGPFKKYPPNRRPSFAVVSKPSKLDFNSPNVDEDGKRVTYELLNEGYTVYFYAIDPITRQVNFVDTENKKKIYHVIKNRLFQAQEGIIPLPINL